MRAEARQLSARLTAALAADSVDAIHNELIGDIVRGVVDEHRQDARRPTAGSMLLEARHRLERIRRARLDATSSTGSAGSWVSPGAPKLRAAPESEGLATGQHRFETRCPSGAGLFHGGPAHRLVPFWWPLLLVHGSSRRSVTTAISR